MSDRAPLHDVVDVPWNGKDSHERDISRHKGPFDKKLRDPRVQENLDVWLEEEATRQADRLYLFFKEHYAEFKRRDPNGSSVLDVKDAADKLWEHLHAAPVTLARKAKLVAVLEPFRKQFTQEGWNERIKELGLQEQEIRTVYLRARAFKMHLDDRNPIGISKHFDPISAFEYTEILSALKIYLAQPRTTLPSKAARFMDEEIRALLPTLQSEGKEVTTHSILFTQTSEAFTEARRVDHTFRALEKERQSPRILQPDKIAALRHVSSEKEKTGAILRTCLQNELKSYDTPSMKAEARSMDYLSNRVFTDKTLYSLYKLSLEATASVNPQESLNALWDEYARLRPGDRMILARLLEYHRKIFLPRRQMLLRQHQKYIQFKEMAPSPARGKLKREVEEISLVLEKPELLDPEAADMDDAKTLRLSEETTMLRKRWQKQVENPATPRTAKEFQPLWEALQAQYTHTLKLLEQTGHIPTDKEVLRLRIKDGLKDILTDIEHVEEHYIRALLSDSTSKIKRLDTEIWLFENAIEPKPNAVLFSKEVSQTLEELRSTFQTIEATYPSIARLEVFRDSVGKLGNLLGRFYLAIEAASSEPATAHAPAKAGPTWRPANRNGESQTEDV